jgi:hypothetical protein
MRRQRGLQSLRHGNDKLIAAQDAVMRGHFNVSILSDLIPTRLLAATSQK